MTLTYLNAELDTTKEHELFQVNNFGFRVEIKYNESFYGFKKLPTQTLSNVTEIHHLFKSILETDKEIAFESDIHGEGFTRKINAIDSVVVSLENEHQTKFVI